MLSLFLSVYVFSTILVNKDDQILKHRPIAPVSAPPSAKILANFNTFLL